MQNIRRSYCLAMIALLLSLAGPGLCERNLCPMGGFEISNDDFQKTFEIGDKKNVTLDAGVALSGKKSLRIVASDSSQPYGTAAAIKIPVNAEKGPVVLQVSCAVKVDKVVPGALEWLSARFYVHGIDKDEKTVGLVDIGDYYYGTKDWTRCQRLVLMPQGTKQLKIGASLAGKSGTAWFDDIKVVDKTAEFARPESGKAVVSLDSKHSIGKFTDGIGWAWDTVSPQRYSAGEAAVWDGMFKLMGQDGTDWIRVGVGPSHYAPSNYEVGKDSGETFNYVLDNRYTRQLCRLLEFCKKRGVPVLICNWGVDGRYEDVPKGMWLCTGAHDPSRRQNSDWNLPYSDERFVEGYCALIKYLVVDKKLSCIKYVSIWNEPDGAWFFPGYVERFFRVYDLMDSRLRTLGIRDRVKLLGPESIEGGIVAPKTARDLISTGKSIDAAAVHDYGPGLPSPTELTSQYKNQHWADGYAEAVRILKENGRGNVPVLLTELGAFGTTAYTDTRMHYLCTLGCADYIVRCIKAGAGGFLRWQYDDCDGDSQYEPFLLKNGRLTIDKSLYWGYTVLTRWTVPNSSILDSQVTGGENGLGIKCVEAVALRAPSGFTSVLLVNSGRSPKTVTLNDKKGFAGRWRHFYYDATLPASIQQGQMSARGNSELTVRVPAESINVVTNCEAGLSGDAPVR